MNEIKILIENINKYLEDNKLSIAQFSKKAGITPTTMGQMLAGKTKFSLMYIERISAATEMSFARLFTKGGADSKIKNSKDLIAESNKDSIIKEQRLEIEKLNQAIERLREESEVSESIREVEKPAQIIEVPTPKDESLRLVIDNGVSKMKLNGVSKILEYIEDTDLLKKQVMVTMVFDEILIK